MSEDEIVRFNAHRRKIRRWVFIGQMLYELKPACLYLKLGGEQNGRSVTFTVRPMQLGLWVTQVAPHPRRIGRGWFLLLMVSFLTPMV
jgi:hypothetical protein